jgi:hypothetical protein
LAPIRSPLTLGESKTKTGEIVLATAGSYIPRGRLKVTENVPPPPVRAGDGH